MLKRKVSTIQKPNPRNHRKKKPLTAPRGRVEYCPADRTGPRIPALLREFAENNPITEHLEWLHSLELSCESQGCCASRCATGSWQSSAGTLFARSHGAKTLVNGINVFITFVLPRFHGIRSEDEWRRALAAMRSFHAFCVRRQYVKSDIALMRAFHRLKEFHIAAVPKKIIELVQKKYWDDLEGDYEEEDIELEKARKEQLKSVGVVEVEDSDYDAFISQDYAAVVVADVHLNGWSFVGEGEATGMEHKPFLALPSEISRLGMKGMSIDGVRFARRREVWRPIEGDDGLVPIVYPPDDVFY